MSMASVLPSAPSLFLSTATALVLPAAALLSACTGTISVSYTDDSNPSVTLQGSELQNELDESPIRTTASPFRRIGAIWEGDRPASIEVSLSSDGGATWAPFRSFEVNHVEMEESGLFVGQIEVDGNAATSYRLRRGEGTASFARLEILADSASESIENRGDTKMDDGGGNRSLRLAGLAEGHGRAEWGARRTRCSRKISSPYRMTIHHTETPTNDTISVEARLRGIQRYHMDVRGWCDIGYHYLVSRDGRVWEGRPENLRGAHAGGANTGNIGISLIGSHETTPITDRQLGNVAALLAELGSTHNIALNRTNIKGHRQHKSTSCPGNALYGQLGELVARAGGLGTPTDEPGDGDGDGDDGSDNESSAVRGVLYEGSDTSARIAGATISLGEQSVVTTSTGLFEFSSVPMGSFTLSATAAGFQARSVTRSTAVGVTWASFGLSKESATGTAVLQGVIYQGSDSSDRVPNASVSLSSGETTAADSTGFYKLTGLSAGPVTISASASGLESASIERTLVDGETEWGSVELGGTPDTGTDDACFQGENNAGTTCFPVVDGNPYSYPSPTNNNYRKPIRWLDVESIDLSTKLSANFRLSEISKTQKGRYQVVQPHAIAKLQLVREAAGNALTINSGFRSPPYNSSVGGARRSRHMYGDAFDIQPGAVGQNGLMNICNNLGAGYVAKYTSGHVHCDWRATNVDPVFYGASGARTAHDHGYGTDDLVANVRQTALGALTVDASGYDETEGELTRDWVALDAAGNEIAHSTAMSFDPPAATLSVRVDVGGILEVTHTIK